MQQLIQRQTNLTAHVVQFSRFLRENGFEIGPNEELDVLKTYQAHIPKSYEEQQNLFKAIWVKNRKQYLLFDELYEQYWRELSRAEDSKNKEVEEETQKRKKNNGQQAPSLSELKSWLYAGRIEEEKEVATYSAFEAMSKKDFSAFVSSEQRELLEIIKLIAKRLANRQNRRYVRSKSPKQIDLKNTIRLSLKRGGEIEKFVFKEQQQRKVNLILLCDVSKSMELYSKFLIEFMYGFQQAVHSIKTFVFSTSLVSLSRILKDSNYEKVLENLSEQVPYWSGGTRIGASLDEFTDKYGAHLLNKDSIVIILSDGWDTGDLETLENAMQSIHKKSERVIWLNPLASNPNYTPSTKGMEVCLPYIDVFTSAHNLESLRSVVRHMKARKYRLR